ncbi:MAG: heme exporter protein CcmD [Pseudomonadales bacterium]|nr:heme exporter protein CcmD [Pseudomonadales bacterium]
MFFDDLAQLWHMDGHGPYVWGAYAIVLLVLVGLVRAPLARRRRALDRVRARLRAARPTSSGG